MRLLIDWLDFYRLENGTVTDRTEAMWTRELSLYILTFGHIERMGGGFNLSNDGGLHGIDF